MEPFAVVGKRVARLDAVEKATGRAVYGVDLRLPGMLHGKVLYSHHPHARILAMDISRAERLLGVKAVVTGEDAPGVKIGFLKAFNPAFADCPPLKRVGDKVLFVGDEVAAVAAVDEDTAEEALGLIRVEYEPLPAVFDPKAAMRSGAPALHEGVANNVLVGSRVEAGDPEGAFQRAHRIFEERYATQAQCHVCPELHQSLASFDGMGGLTVWSSIQMPFFLRRDLADVLGLPESKVRVLVPRIGGGFGSRMEMHPLDPICALLSRKAGRPVRVLFDREEEFLSTRMRHPMTVRVKSAVDREGRLLALDLRVIIDSGAYCSQAPSVMVAGLANGLSLYRLENLRYEASIVYTNKPYGGAFRGYGKTQVYFAIESHMDTIARALGMSPSELRRVNGHQAGDVTAFDFAITSCAYGECLERVAQEVAGGKRRSAGGYRGMGVASVFDIGGGVRAYGNTDVSGALVKVEDDGSAVVLVGGQEIGQGSHTTYAQIAAEELGLRLEEVRVESGDTDVVPWDVGTHGSRSTFVAGNAIRLAAQDARRQLLAMAAQRLEARGEDLELREGRVYVRGSPHGAVSISEVVRSGHYREGGSLVLGKGSYDPPSRLPHPVTRRGNKSAAYAFGAQAAEVEVDLETGEVRLLNLVSAHDVGRVINPLGAEGQVEGGLALGAGFALSEVLLMEGGQALNPNPLDYKLPTALDLPPVRTILVESVDPRGPFGAKGMGEAPVVSVAPAIANAIQDAVGVRLRELPMTPERVHRALKGKE